MYYRNEKLQNVERIYDGEDRSNYLRLDLNENPEGLPEEFVERVLKKVSPELLARYPETEGFRACLAEHLNASPEQIFLTNGSAEAIRHIFEAFTSPGGRIAAVSPSYFMFNIYSQLYGRKLISIPYGEELKMSAEKIIGALTEDTELLILVHPNNPMGDIYSAEEFKEILEVCRQKEIMVLVDEAYHYFCSDSFMEYALNGSHVIVTRSFSKFFSLAGCRLGYAAGSREDIEFLRKLQTPHNVNAVALLFAGELIKDEKLREKLYSDFINGRKWLIDELDKNNYRHIGEAGNFLFIEPKSNSEELVRRMKEEKKILIKTYKGIGGTESCLRVTVGSERSMRRFTEALLELDK